ncbi:MAG: cyanophycin synthetase [Planctomycetota bacterium]|nr:cyanophycin synthetase [Planctomycetota bacterium]
MAVKENIVAFGDDENLRMALSELDGRVTWYGLSQHNDYRATHVKPLGLGRSFDLEGPDGKVGQFRCPMLGEYNLHNCVGALALGHKLGLDVESMADSTAGLHGVVRRQDLLGERNGVKVLDDYAHHPTEIEATIRAVAELSPKRLVVVFQPHRYSRTAALHKELARSLTAADYVILSNTGQRGPSRSHLEPDCHGTGFAGLHLIPAHKTRRTDSQTPPIHLQTGRPCHDHGRGRYQETRREICLLISAC